MMTMRISLLGSLLLILVRDLPRKSKKKISKKQYKKMLCKSNQLKPKVVWS
jgi:hypothetical protein